MNLGVCRIVELACRDRIGIFRQHLIGARNRALHAFVGRREFDLRAENGEHLAPFQRHAFRHAKDELVTARSTDEGKRDACIARRRLNDDRVFDQFALALQRVDHRDADAVFDARHGIKEFKFEQHISNCACVPRHAVEAHERRVANCLCDVVVDATASGFLV